MRLRKQSKPTAQPGDEFLRAVSSGRERPSPAPAPARPAAGSPGLEERLLESERRAAAADEALRQIREDQDDRLEQARAALAQERQARIAAEERLVEQTGSSAPEQPLEPEPLEPEYLEPEPGDYAEAADPPPAEPAADLTFPATSRQPAAEGDEPEDGWPAPWLDDEQPAKRGLFRRSRS
ncbi:MAG TPA: hypothetical protein VEX39_17990 [Thermoleophilaceae bacterium]|nr:hypothetical protein [Thermoleophilaceae bacterium]